MKKSILTFVLMLTAIAAGAQEFNVGNFRYVVTDNVNHYVSVAQNSENAPKGAIVIPSSVSNNAVTYTVTSIAESAFNWNTDITGVTLPRTLTSIGDYAFYGCTSLASFSVPGSVTTIGSQVFDYCSIPTFTFEASNSAITCNSGIPCTDHLYLYREVNYGGTLTNTIKALTIGANVTTIYNGMFYGSYRLNSIDFSAATGLTSIGEYAFGSCGTFDGSDEEPASHLTTVDLSNTKVTSIGENAFNYCTKLTTITLPSTLETIGNYAFYFCSSLTSFSVPGSVTTIGSQVFDYCSIPTFTFEASNSAITCNSGIPCTDHLYLYREVNYGGTLTNTIKALTIGANVTTIYNSMFYGSYRLNSVDFSAATGLTSIGEYAFSSCGTFDGSDEEPASHLTTVDLSKTKVTSIGHSAFTSCSKLTTITLPSTLTSIGDYAFFGCESLASFSVPGSVTTIGSQVFDYCSIPTFTFEASNTAINCSAIIPCTDHLYLYRDINMEGTLTTSIKKLTIGDAVTSIGTTFCWCNDITDITVPWLSSPIAIADDAFADDIYANATLWIPGGTKDIYGNAGGWKKFAKNDFSSYVVSFTGSAYGTLAVGRIVSTDNETQTIRIDRESDVVFTVTPATGCELTTFTVNGAAQTVTEGQYTIKNLSADLTVMAGFKVSRYTITFDSNGGSEVTAITQDYGTAITLPDNPTRTGYDFIGWSPEVPATMPAKNMTVVAQWSDIKKCATPTIALVNNEIVFSCETTDVEFVSEVKCPDAGEYVSSSIPLTKTYIVSVYAKKEGFNDSDVAIKEINIGGTGGIRGDVNEDGEVNVGDIVVISNIMSGNE